MTLPELKDGLETYGADLKRWPAALAEAALDLLAASPEAQDLFAAATAEDMALFPKTDGEAVSRLTERTLDAVAPARRRPKP